MVPPDSDRISLVPPYSGYSYVAIRFQIHDFHVLRSNFPEDSSIKLQSTLLSYNPGHAVTPPVWANPRSLATTCGITVVFSSCGYLDVSVPRVRPCFAGDTPSGCRVPPFGNPRINGHLRLPGAYRSLSRPSSPLRAQASPVRSYLTFSSRVSNCKSYSVSPLPRLCRFGAHISSIRLILGACISAGSLCSPMCLFITNMSNISRAGRRSADCGGLPSAGPIAMKRQRQRGAKRLRLHFFCL